MNNDLQTLYKNKQEHPDTIGILLIEDIESYERFQQSFDKVILIVMKNLKKDWSLEEYIVDEKKIGLVTVSKTALNRQGLIEWLMLGDILFERKSFLKNMKARLISFPKLERLKKIGLEYASFIEHFSKGKQLFTSKQYLESFHHIAQALHHVARISIIENGKRPTITLWEQVNEVNPEIYHLYNEFVTSQEPLEKRIELLILVNSVTLNKYACIGSQHILHVMNTKDTFWSINEIISHPDLKDYGFQLIPLLEHLIDTRLLDVKWIQSDLPSFYYRMYYPAQSEKIS